jgi:hypothetical protein
MARARRPDEIDPTLSMPGLDVQGLDVGAPDPSSSTPPPINGYPGYDGSGINPQPKPSAGGFDLEGIRGLLGFGQADLSDPSAWLAQNQNVAKGVTIRGDKMYDPTGKYLADVISNHKQGGTRSQFLDGINSKGQKRPKLRSPGGKKGSNKAMGMMAASTAPPINTSKGPSIDDVGNELRKLFPTGLYNNQLVSDRTSSASDDINRQRKSRMATNQAALAERGLIGDGPEMSAMNRMEEDLFDEFTGSVRDIRADESENADQRMMLALTTAAGLSTDQAALVIDRFRAENDDKYNMGSLDLGHRNADINETLGLGNLALGNLTASNNYNLGAGNLNLGYDTLNSSNTNTTTDQLIDLLEIYMRGAQTTTEGAR